MVDSAAARVAASAVVRVAASVVVESADSVELAAGREVPWPQPVPWADAECR